MSILSSKELRAIEIAKDCLADGSSDDEAVRAVLREINGDDGRRYSESFEFSLQSARKIVSFAHYLRFPKTELYDGSDVLFVERLLERLPAIIAALKKRGTQ